MTNDKYIRKGLKWAKVSKLGRRRWLAAFGWKDQIKAVRVTYHMSQYAALDWAQSWVDDQKPIHLEGTSS